MHVLRALLLVVLAAGSVGARSRPRRDRASHPDRLLVARHLAPSEGIAIRVDGLDREGIYLLAMTRPAGDRLLDLHDGAVELWTTSDGLLVWLHGFLAASHRSPRPVPLGRWRGMSMATVNGPSAAMRQEALWRLSRPETESGSVATHFTPEMLWRPRAQDDHDAMSLISWHNVRQVLVRATAVIEASTIDPRRRDRVADGVRVAASVRDWFEVGGGYRRLQAPVTDGPFRGGIDESSVVFVRAGIARAIASSRITIPVALDAGGGPSIMLHSRLHLGVRFGLNRGRYIGVELFAPTYTRYLASSGASGNPRWSYRSSVEAGVTF